MNDRQDIPPLPEPWPGAQSDGEVPPTQPSSPSDSSGGCGKPILFGCGCMSLCAVLALILMVAMSGRIVNWFLDTTETTILAALPDDLGAEEREQLVSNFRAFRAGIEDGSLNTRGLTQLQVELTNAYSRAQRGLLERVDIERLLAAFEGVLVPTDGDSGSRNESESLAPTVPAEVPIAAASSHSSGLGLSSVRPA